VKNSEIMIVRDTKFFCYRGQWFSPVVDYENTFRHYLSVFNSTTILGKLYVCDRPVGNIASGPGVKIDGIMIRGGFKLLSLFVGALTRAFLFCFLDRKTKIILRIPGVFPQIVGLVLIMFRHAFAVEVVADPADEYDTAALGNHLPYAKLLKLFMVWSTKQLTAHATATAYVTKNVLQRKYPPGKIDRSFGFTSTILRDEAFVKMPLSVKRFTTGKIRMVHVGSMQHRLKGQDIVIKALNILIHRQIDASVEFIGDGNSRVCLENLAKELGLSNRCKFHGFISSLAEIRRILDKADIFVLPSRREGLPRALLEAMARGLPAVATSIAGIPELLESDWLIRRDCVSSLVEILQHAAMSPKVLAIQSKKNLMKAREYQVENVYPQRLDFYNVIKNG